MPIEVSTWDPTTETVMASSKRELIEPNKGDKRYVRRD